MGLARHIDVVGVTTASSDKTSVLSPPHGLRNTELFHCYTVTSSCVLTQDQAVNNYLSMNCPLAWSFGQTITRLPF